MTEPAVRTACGHNHGAKCLDIWVEAGNNTCPQCRQDLLELEHSLPSGPRQLYTTLTWTLYHFASLDETMDGHLFAGARQTFDKNFGCPLHQLADFTRTVVAMKDAFRKRHKLFL